METVPPSIPVLPLPLPLPLLLLIPLLPVLLVTYHYHLATAHSAPRIPFAHWSAAVSRVWILHKRFRRRENAALAEAHGRLGPYVRVAPGEVSVVDIEGVRVYGGGFDKAGWYGVFDNYG